MLTINRNRTEDKRNKSYDSRDRERNYQSNSYRTLEEDYQNTVRENINRREDELWMRLNSTAPSDATDREEFNYNRNAGYREQDNRDYYRSSSYEREQDSSRLPYYDTEAPVSSMAMKKYAVTNTSTKKKNNVVGKVILAAYVAIIALVATLVIVDSTMKTSAASSATVATESEYQYTVVSDTQESGNWFDNFCDKISKAMGD